MSGGSYNYLYIKDVPDLFGMTAQLQQMADRLAGLGYADDAAKEATELLLMVRQAWTRIDTRHTRLSEVFQAVEWWDSCDWGEDDVKEALAKYRKALEG